MTTLTRTMRILIALILLGAAGLSLPEMARAAPHDVTITVTTKDDEFIVDGGCALREAIYAANWNTPYDNCPGGDSSGMDTIVFAMGEGYVLGTWLPPVLDAGPLTIGGGYLPDLMGNSSTQVLIVENGANLTLTNVMISGGYVTGGEDGAGLYNDGGTVTIEDCYFIGNTADGTDSNGGAIYNNAGSLTISNTTFLENTAYEGGGIYNYLGTLTFALQNPSPAINNANVSNCPTTDQRTFFRRIGFCDVGAFEAQPYVFYIVSGDWQSTYINTTFPLPLVVEAQDIYGTPLGGVPVTFVGPASGASIANNLADLVTILNGTVSLQAIANGSIGGPYEVVATHSADGVYTTFHLTNLGYETTTTITSDDPDPSEPGQLFNVTFNVTSPNGTPEGWVTVQGRSEECTGWVSSGTGGCTLSIDVPGSFTLNGEFGSNSSFAPSSDTEPHTVQAPPGWQMSIFLPVLVK